jgi:integrase/recombinase XerD
MPATLQNVLSHVQGLQNRSNAAIVQEFYEWMKENDKSEAYRKNNVKAITHFAEWLYKRDCEATFFDVNKRDIFLRYLETKMKTKDVDPDGKWITTWNDYLARIKLFYRWVYNYQSKKDNERLPLADWKTPDFLQIRYKKTQRASPYSATEVWELEELLTIVKYESQQRNKAAIMLMWDLNARNHELTNLRIKNVRLKENYAEGEIPEGKTGSGPILLTTSFPYVRDWLNLHPLKNNPDARLICDLNTGKALKPERIWFMMTNLKERIQTMLNEGLIDNKEEQERLKGLLQTKKWNPYCLRHSSIEHDSGYLPEFALRKKVRWTIDSRQPARYIKNKWTPDIKRQVLNHNGILTEQDNKPKLTSRICPRCNTVNALENDYCSKKDCGYPLTPVAYEQVKEKEQQTENQFMSLQKQMQSVFKVILAQSPKEKNKALADLAAAGILETIR